MWRRSLIRSTLAVWLVASLSSAAGTADARGVWALGFNTSVAVWVGMIGLLGIAAETASIMVIYLDEGYRQWRDAGRLHTSDDLIAMAMEAATLRVRPLLMTVAMNIMGLIRREGQLRPIVARGER